MKNILKPMDGMKKKKAGLGDRFMNSVEKRLQQISEHPEYFGSEEIIASEKPKLNTSLT